MSRLLYIEASPREEKSYSSRAAVAFLDSYREHHPQDEIDHLHLFRDTLPDFGQEGANQKMAHIAALIAGDPAHEAAGQWSGVVREIERLKSADKVLISSPMWNYSVPYRLKQYIDLICQPGLTFYVNRKGEYVGMVRGKPLQLILSSGSEYARRFPREDDGTKTDFQRPYLEHIARFIGFEDIRCLQLQPTEAAGPEAAATMLTAKLEEAREAGQNFQA